MATVDQTDELEAEVVELRSALQEAISCALLLKKEVEDYHECDYAAGQWDTAEKILNAMRAARAGGEQGPRTPSL